MPDLVSLNVMAEWSNLQDNTDSPDEFQARIRYLRQSQEEDKEM